MVKHFAFYFTLCCMLIVSCGKDDGTKNVPARRTVIVYMAADNDLSDDARDNIREPERLSAVTNQLIAGRTFDAATFDRASVQRLDVYEEQYAFDFLDFMEKAFPDADVNPLKEQLDKTVLYKAHTPEFIKEYAITAYCGLSCYIPHPQREDLNAYYRQLDWSRASGFYSFFN